jgi:hypothetical protein
LDFEEDYLLSGIVFTSLVVLCLLMHRVARALGRNHTHVLFRCRKAEQKAVALLKQWLSSAQLAQYESNGHFEVTGSHSGRRYRIRRGRQMNIDELDEHGAQIAVWCFGPEGYLPVGDVMLAQKIALETDEHAALAVANRSH